MTGGETMPRNERNAGRKRKLTPLEESNIIAEAKNGTARMELAWKYKLSEATIYRILRRGLNQLK